MCQLCFNKAGKNLTEQKKPKSQKKPPQISLRPDIAEAPSLWPRILRSVSVYSYICSSEASNSRVNKIDVSALSLLKPKGLLGELQVCLLSSEEE